jgi:hypothetical protein
MIPVRNRSRSGIIVEKSMILRLLLDIGIPLLISGAIIKFARRKFQTVEKPLAIPGLIVATFLWFGFVGDNLGRLFIGDYLGLLPDIAVSYKSFEFPSSLYLFGAKIILFFIASYGVFLSIRLGPIWAAWIFCLIAVIFNPWWHQGFDGNKLIWQIIKNGLTIWLGVAGFLLYPHKNKREKLWNKYALFVPAMFAVVLLLYHLSRYWRIDAWRHFSSEYGFFLVVKAVVFSTAIYGTIVSFLFGPKWFMGAFFLIIVYFNPLSRHSITYKEEGLVVLLLLFSSFCVKSNNNSDRTISWNPVGLLFSKRGSVSKFFSWKQTLFVAMGWILSLIFVMGMMRGFESIPSNYLRIIGDLFYPLANLFEVPLGLVVLAIIIVIGVISSVLINCLLLHGEQLIAHWNQKVAFVAAIIAWIIAWVIVFDHSNLDGVKYGIAIVKAISSGLVVHGSIGYVRAAWMNHNEYESENW